MLDILVKDNNGDPYMVPNTAFNVGMLDLTHPKTATWFKQILREMVDDGVRGWMADFGEGLPVDAVLHSGLYSYLVSIKVSRDHFKYLLQFTKKKQQMRKIGSASLLTEFQM